VISISLRGNSEGNNPVKTLPDNTCAFYGRYIVLADSINNTHRHVRARTYKIRTPLRGFLCAAPIQSPIQWNIIFAYKRQRVKVA